MASFRHLAPLRAHCTSVSHVIPATFTSACTPSFSSQSAAPRTSIRARQPCAFQQKRFAHRFPKGATPNLDKLQECVYTKFRPIHFMVKNDMDMGPYLYDQHFTGILCSPLFEGKTPAQTYRMWERAMKDIGLKGRTRFTLRPPSQWDMLKYKATWNYICH